MALEPRVVALVPSLGRSPFAAEALDALRAELASFGGELLWIAPDSVPPPGAAGAHDRWLRTGGALGFAAAIDLGLRQSQSRFVALVNDDALVEPGWLAALVAELEREPALAAVQGVVVERADAGRCDGCGIGWNRWWQAVQLGRGTPPPERTSAPFEPFGVSATAALYRRSALERASLPGGAWLELRLDSWYEDVELAIRLRAHGGAARTLPAVRCRHAGSTTGRAMGARQRRWLARNRILVVARLLGRRFPLALPRLLARDLADFARALAHGEIASATAIVLGTLAAAHLLPAFAHTGRPLVEPAELARFGAPQPISSEA